MKDVSIDERCNEIQNSIDKQIVGKKESKELVYDIDDETIDQDPYDPRYMLDDGNKVDFIKYIEQWVV